MSTWPNHTDRVVADVGAGEGTWTGTTDSRGVRGWATGIVTKQSSDARANAYVRANGYALHTEFYLSTKKAARFAGKWIALAPENGPYPGVFSEVTRSASKDRRTFSRWNEQVHAKAPAHALTYCQVFGC